MSEVQKYSQQPIEDGYEVIEWDDGEFVLSSDYDQLKAENERLKAVPMKYKRMEHNAKLQSENDTLREQLDEAREILCAFAMEHVETISWLERNKL